MGINLFRHNTSYLQKCKSKSIIDGQRRGSFKMITKNIENEKRNSHMVVKKQIILRTLQLHREPVNMDTLVVNTT